MVQTDTDDGYYLAWSEGILRNRGFNWCKGTFLNFRLTQDCGLVTDSNVPAYNKYAPGTALLLLPFNAIGLILMKFGIELGGRDPFIFWSLVGTFFLFLAGALLLQDISLRILKASSVSYWMTAFFLFGNVLLYYVFRRPLMAQAGEFFLFFLCTWICVRWAPHRQPSPPTTIFLGFFSGLLVITRLTSFYALGLFLFPSIYGAWQISRRKMAEHLVLFAVGAILPIGFFLFTNYVQTGALFYNPSKYDAEFTLRSLFLSHPRNWKRIWDFFGGPHWGAFFLMPFMAIEVVVILLRWRSVLKWALETSWLIPAIAFCFLVHLINMANFPMHGGAYGYRYVLTAYYGLHVLFLVCLSRVTLSRSMRTGLMCLGIVASMIAWLNIMNYESNQSDLTLTWGKLRDEGTVDPAWVDSTQLTCPNYAMTSLRHIFRLKAIQNLGVIPAVAYPAHVLKPRLRNIRSMEKFWEYYESPKRMVYSIRDLLDFAVFQGVLLLIIGWGALALYICKLVREKRHHTLIRPRLVLES